MASSIRNSWSGVGRLTKDINVESTKSGTKVLHNSLAINNGKDKDGNERPATFIPLVFFGKSAELIESYCHKGSRLAVQGEITTGSYQNNDGKTVYTWDINVDSFEFLDGKSESSTAPAVNSARIAEGFTPVVEEDLPVSDFMSMFKN